MKTLQELTGMEAGIVIYYGDGGRPEGIICNWSSIEGYPRIDPLGLTVLGFGEEIPEVEAVEIKDLRELVKRIDVVFENGEEIPNTGLLFQVEDNISVICPEDWC